MEIIVKYLSLFPFPFYAQFFRNVCHFMVEKCYVIFYAPGWKDGVGVEGWGWGLEVGGGDWKKGDCGGVGAHLRHWMTEIKGHLTHFCVTIK